MANWDVTTANSSLEFDTQNFKWPGLVQMDSTHFLATWCGGSSTANSYAQVFTVNGSTYAVSTANSSLNFSGNYGYATKVAYMDATHCVAWYQYYSSNYENSAQVLTISTSTWAVTTASARKSLGNGANGNTDGSYGDIVKIDTNHFLVTFIDGGYDGFAQVITVNTSTFEVTTAASSLEYDTQQAFFSTLLKIDDTHFVNIWQDTSGDGQVQVLAVNTSTWAVTTAGALLEFDTQNYRDGSLAAIDSTHFIVVWLGGEDDAYGKPTNNQSQIFTVNTTTWAITTANSVFTFQTGVVNQRYNSLIKIDTNHFNVSYKGEGGGDAYTRMLEVSTSTWAVSTVGSILNFDASDPCSHFSSCAFDTNHFINIRSDANSDGFVQAFTVTLPASGPANLKTLNTNAFANIKSINTNLIANVKTYNTQT